MGAVWRGCISRRRVHAKDDLPEHGSCAEGARQHAISRAESLGRPYAVVWARRISCVDAVPTLAGDGCRRRSLLHGCYTWASTWM